MKNQITNWHIETITKFRKKTEAELLYIIQDCKAAIEAGKDFNPKVNQYEDEIHYACMELNEREKKRQVKAINEKYQSIVNKFIEWNKKYESIVDSTNDTGGSKQETAYNKANEYFIQLPKREQKNLGELALGYGE